MSTVSSSTDLQILGPEKAVWELGLSGRNIFIMAQFSGPTYRGFYFDDTKNNWEKLLKHLNQVEVAVKEIKIVGTAPQYPALGVWQERIRLGKGVDAKWIERPTGSKLRFWAKEGTLQASKSDVSDVNVVNHTTQATPHKKIKVLVVDDSKTVRIILEKLFSKHPELEVVATAELPSLVEGLIQKFQPDVITLDIHMPEMNGVELLKKVIKRYSIPTVMITSISMEEGPLVMEALNNGAIDYIQKPSLAEMDEVGAKIIEKVIAAAGVNLKALKASNSNKIQSPVMGSMGFKSIDNGIILIGSSTGGTQALQVIFEMFPNDIPPILVVQHIPPIFSKALADRLNTLCPFTVKEAEHGEAITPNKILIAPGGKQMGVVSRGKDLQVVINDDPPVNRFRPSVDYLFHSYCKVFSRPTVGLILTGMGKDGAQGLLDLKNKGALTMAQDEASSVVFGMPKEAIRIGAAHEVKSLNDIAYGLSDLYNRAITKRAA